MSLSVYDLANRDGGIRTRDPLNPIYTAWFLLSFSQYVYARVRNDLAARQNCRQCSCKSWLR